VKQDIRGPARIERDLFLFDDLASQMGPAAFGNASGNVSVTAPVDCS